MAPVDLGSLSGRGLRIVDELAARWGAAETQAGKTVWVEYRVA